MSAGSAICDQLTSSLGVDSGMTPDSLAASPAPDPGSSSHAADSSVSPVTAPRRLDAGEAEAIVAPPKSPIARRVVAPPAVAEVADGASMSLPHSLISAPRAPSLSMPAIHRSAASLTAAAAPAAGTFESRWQLHELIGRGEVRRPRCSVAIIFFPHLGILTYASALISTTHMHPFRMLHAAPSMTAVFGCVSGRGAAPAGSAAATSSG